MEIFMFALSCTKEKKHKRPCDLMWTGYTLNPSTQNEIQYVGVLYIRALTEY